MIRLLVFAGTAEGRLFIDEFRRAVRGPYRMRVFTATEYGRDILLDTLALPEDAPIEIRPGRLDAGAMYREILLFKPSFVVDCTHPYADEVTRNLREACRRAPCEYLRLRRESSPLPEDVSAVSVDTLAEAAGYLRDQAGNILVTTGSKDLEPFTDQALRNRVILRVLPLAEGIEKCRALGFPPRNIIAMQGPFSEDLNRALIRSFKVSWLLTKETGGGGGFPEKLRAARQEGVSVVILRRPPEDQGRDLREILKIILGGNGRRERPRWFPVFLNIAGKRFLLVGGGKIALRRVLTLLKFDCTLTILAEGLCGELRALADQNRDRIEVLERPFAPGDCGAGADFVLALTNRREVNRRIAEECRERGIPVSVADYREDSSFFFPAVVQAGDLVIGLSSGGTDHRLVKGAAEKVRRLFEAEGGP
jgi:precorrin-2 dehydrogenase/sirohydrochlorin ferrochelatase/precorrin-6A/cobalt-precorrin-6A reductase